MSHAILLDFGSTFTKMAVASFSERVITHTFKVPSTVRTDARLCLEQCLAKAKQHLGSHTYQQTPKLASSSAAGGLRMAVLGLTKTLSMSAARNAAFGAGAKLMGAFIGKLDAEAMAALQALDIEILLFTGGYEGGNTTTLEHNARMLAASSVNVPIIFAGNSEMDSVVRHTLKQSGKQCLLVPNIIPHVQSINAGPTEEIIRHVFMHSIINMKGLSAVQAALDAPITPTPAVVLQAGKLLSAGTESQVGLGPLALVDVGGATTDIHSYVDHVGYKGARLAGAPEPFAKRTVEGDLGMRESSASLALEVGLDTLCEALRVPVSALQAALALRGDNRDFLPQSPLEQSIDQEIAARAVYLAARRHAGWIKSIPEGCNCKFLQYGKNLTTIRTVVGTGGQIINSDDPKYILSNMCDAYAQKHSLLPDNASYKVDKQYTLFSAGLLQGIDKDLAFSVMNNSITDV